MNWDEMTCWEKEQYASEHCTPAPSQSVLPQQQRKVLDCIKGHLATNGYPPSIADIQEHIGASSTAGVRKHIAVLEKKGFVERRGGSGLHRNLYPVRSAEGGPRA